MKKSIANEKKIVKKNVVKFKQEPIWFRGSFIGKYNGINFRFEFKEYTSTEAEKVVKSFKFKWPGRVPDDKTYAEKGIRQLFLKRRKDGSLVYTVLADNADALAEIEEEQIIHELVKEELENEDLQKRLEGEDKKP